MSIAMHGDNQGLCERQLEEIVERLVADGQPVYRAWVEPVEAKAVNHELRVTEIEVPE